MRSIAASAAAGSRRTSPRSACSVSEHEMGIELGAQQLQLGSRVQRFGALRAGLGQACSLAAYQAWPAPTSASCIMVLRRDCQRTSRASGIGRSRGGPERRGRRGTSSLS